MDKIWTTRDKKDEKFLRQKTPVFDFKKMSREKIRELVKMMRGAMRQANGIGLSANQMGLPLRFFVAQVPDSQGKLKFYAIFNPEIIKNSEEKQTLEEGCLSVPEAYGPVKRSYRIVLSGIDQSGKKVKIKAWGLLARVFQHEIDHLNGKVFTDSAEEIYTTPISERLKKRSEKIN